MPTLEITTNIGCPLMCAYCPQAKLKTSYGKNMKWLSFTDFVAILAKVPRYVRIDFSGMSEPWINSECTAMLRHALRRGYNVALYTTLVGLTDPDDVIGLLRGHREQVECVVIHLPDDQGNMLGFIPTGQYDRALKAFIAFDAEGGTKWFRWMAMGAAVSRNDVATTMEWIANDRAGSLSGERVEPVQHETPVSCSFTPFYDQNVLLPNGDVVLCCMDYELKHKIGNLLTDDYFALFASPEMGRLRAENTKCGGDGSICKRCVRATRYEVSPGFKQFWAAA